MELDSFLASPRWEILKVIIENPSSPTRIAEVINTTVSFVSQQLKLLEAAGIVTKSRTGEVNKGKPRTIFSISEESFYMIPLAKGLDDKKLISLSREHKAIIKIWSIENKKIQFALEKFFWIIQKYLDNIKEITIYTKKLSPKIYIRSLDEDLTHKINEAKKTLDEPLEFQVTSSSSFGNLDSEFTVSIYDEQEYLANKDLLKGGFK